MSRAMSREAVPVTSRSKRRTARAHKKSITHWNRTLSLSKRAEPSTTEQVRLVVREYQNNCIPTRVLADVNLFHTEESPVELLAQRVIQLLPARGSVVIFDANPIASDERMNDE